MSPGPGAQQARADASSWDSPSGAEHQPASAQALRRRVSTQIFPGLILSDIKPAKRMKFKTVCYLLVQLMHCRKMFKAEIPFSDAVACEGGDKVGPDALPRTSPVVALFCLVAFHALLGEFTRGPLLLPEPALRTSCVGSVAPPGASGLPSPPLGLCGAPGLPLVWAPVWCSAGAFLAEPLRSVEPSSSTDGSPSWWSGCGIFFRFLCGSESPLDLLVSAGVGAGSWGRAWS